MVLRFAQLLSQPAISPEVCLLLLRALGGDACHSNKSCCPPQSPRVTKELVPQRGVHWPCFSLDNIMEWAVLEQVLACHWGCVTRTAIRLASLELTVHMSIHPVVSCSQSNQDDLVCSVQVVVTICGVKVRVLMIPFSCCERSDHGLIFVGDVCLSLVQGSNFRVLVCGILSLSQRDLSEFSSLLPFFISEKFHSTDENK